MYHLPKTEGLDSDESNKEKNREATETIKTVIVNYSNSDGYSYFGSQVGAVIASLESNISQSEEISSIQKMTTTEKTYGFVYNGKIYLNPELMNSNAAVQVYHLPKTEGLDSKLKFIELEFQ